MAGFNQSEFLDLVYGAALEPSLWAPAMERYADAIGGEKGWLSLLDLRGGGAGGIIARIDPCELDRYSSHYADRNPLHLVADPDRWLRSWAPRVLTDEDWMPKSDLVASEYYNDFLKPQDIHSCLMVRLAVRGSETATINITRGRRRGQFDFADLELARSLHPHLLRAFDLGQKLATDRALGGGLTAVFDASPHGLFLTDGEGRVQRMNAAGEAMAMARSGLLLAGGRLAATDPAAARTLQGLVAKAAARDASARAGGSTSLPTANGTACLSATVAPVRADGLGLLDAPPVVIVCVTDLAAGVRLPEQKLRDIFSLTTAEARLALALFEGETVREAALSLRISRFTAQNHLARVFEKTGTNRQAVLIKLMMQIVGVNLG
ncbi:helix-turn-helix transcriptional regulator [Phenylobacterium sp.]|uniref:helix-turn-helix transcriptional regulator n=1 Tax=Phenylobacterium sp. TaxID=1871053 RepID=UPI00121673F5|nr:helix-turn-helix transcriptional regulator [Phenylobacterium sp.]THD61682.1 MAG: helix-turn-helix transcriptional regulator [Phenylobacterium sp.]